MRKRKPFQSNIPKQKSGCGPEHLCSQRGNHLQHVEHPPGSQQVYSPTLGSGEEGPCGQVTHSITQYHRVGSRGHSPGHLNLFYFNISIQLSCHLISLLEGLQAAIQNQASSSPSQGWYWLREVVFGCHGQDAVCLSYQL